MPSWQHGRLLARDRGRDIQPIDCAFKAELIHLSHHAARLGLAGAGRMHLHMFIHAFIHMHMRVCVCTCEIGHGGKAFQLCVMEPVQPWDFLPLREQGAELFQYEEVSC